jgi:hypothetical protein
MIVTGNDSPAEASLSEPLSNLSLTTSLEENLAEKAEEQIYTDSIHSIMLSTLNLTLYDAFIFNLPTFNNPLDCLDKNSRHVHNIMQDLWTSMNDGVYHPKFSVSMIY